MEINVFGETLQLFAERAIFWPRKRTLFVADTHFGKTAHFRQNGIFVPDQVLHTDIERLNKLISITNPTQCVILGDFFHSTLNADWLQVHLKLLVANGCKFIIITGNHDRYTHALYKDFNIESFTKLEIEPFTCIHDFQNKEDLPQNTYYLSGHLHPAVTISGKARQSIRLPCFYFGKAYAILPAFGYFTGMYTIAIKPDDMAFAIANHTIFPIKKEGIK